MVRSHNLVGVAIGPGHGAIRHAVRACTRRSVDGPLAQGTLTMSVRDVAVRRFNVGCTTQTRSPSPTNGAPMSSIHSYPAFIAGTPKRPDSPLVLVVDDDADAGRRHQDGAGGAVLVEVVQEAVAASNMPRPP